MKNKLNVTLLTVLSVLFLLPTPSYAQKSKKKNKESFQWVMPPLSGNQIIDEYLKSCDDCWNETLNLTKGLTVPTMEIRTRLSHSWTRMVKKEVPPG
jgi:hypothetical protein